MKILGVETSSLTFSVAASDGSDIVASIRMEEQPRTSLRLSDMIQSALDKAGWKPEELDGFAVSIGPGSFTGLRVGVMTVKTLAWALRKPVLPVSSLEVLANNLPKSDLPVIPFVDARKGNVYVASFEPTGTVPLRRINPDTLMRPELAVRCFHDPEGLLVGDGLKRYAELVKSSAPAGVEQAPPEHWVPRAEVLCLLAAAKWPEGLMDDPHLLVPQYLYSQDSDIIGKQQP